MDRRARRGRDRTTTGAALLLSVAVHAALFAWIRLDLPAAEARAADPGEPLRDVPDAWVERPLEVVRIATTEAADAPARSPTRAPGVAVLRFQPPRPTLPRATLVATLAAHLAPIARPHALDLTRAEAESAGGAALGEATSAGAVARSGARRGVILRGGADTASARGDWDFTAASEAAREAERRRRGSGNGTDGIGTIVGGGKGRCPAPGG